jgi:threonyl-tRNA synthetase
MSVELDEVLVGEYYIITPDGKIFYPDEFETDDENLKSLIEKEALGVSRKYVRSPHITYMRRLRLAEVEPLSDAGHLVYLPKGALVLDLLMDYALDVVRRIGGFPVKTSIMYDLKAPSIMEHANLFGQRMYKVKPGKREFVLRYAACFGQFAMLSRHYIDENDLPLKVFEIADSYRYEQRGEVSGLTRVRRFYMPDLHIFTRDLESAMDEFYNIFKLIFEEGYKFGWTYYNLYNITEDFLKEYFDFILRLVKYEDKPILVYIVESGKYYWKINIEFHYIDSQGRPLETATVQIDVGNSKRFNIRYRGRDGRVGYPVILHTAIHGSLERFLFEFLEEAAKMAKDGKKPMLPVWLSPTQVRILPVSTRYLDYAYNILTMLRDSRVRVDIDDRDMTLAKKIRNAEMEWIPYIVVIGEKEVKNNILSVRVRSEGGKEYSMTLNELIERLNSEIGEYPFRDIYYSEFLSKRPQFI